MFLLIDTCQKSCNLSLIKDKEIIDSISVPTNNNLTDLVVELISEMFNKNNIKINEINRIYLTNGPGSFTGIRVGLIITKL
ncbi:hypothetical protein FACS189459_0880 [Bacilli bacterium]|nr:hypothetical protein FACS189459_0880 [Bacilli bacterium]